MKTQIIILAAGNGTRMKSDQPKALVPLRGRPMIDYLAESVCNSQLDTEPIVVVSPNNHRIISAALSGYAWKYAVQTKPLGTGQAVASAQKLVPSNIARIIVLYCDHPFIKTESIKRLAGDPIQALTIMPVKLEDFNDWRRNFYHWGRIIRDSSGRIEMIKEFKDADSSEIAICEVNSGLMGFNNDWLWENIGRLRNDNLQKEYYLTSLAELAFSQGFQVRSLNIEALEAIGINSQEELIIAENLIAKMTV